MQNVFTDRRAYVSASTYDIETETSASSKQSKQKDLDEYKQEVATVKYPDGSKQDYNYPHLEETYNELRNERTELSARTRGADQAGQRAKGKARCLRLRPHGRTSRLRRSPA